MKLSLLRFRDGRTCSLVVGFIYANGFEYCLHRFLLPGAEFFAKKTGASHHAQLSGIRSVRSIFRGIVGSGRSFYRQCDPFFILEWAFNHRWSNGWTAGAFRALRLLHRL